MKNILAENMRRFGTKNLNEQTTAVINKVATEGLKNITSEMIASPPFIGTFSGYSLTGKFNGVDYTWILNGVEGISGIRGEEVGQVGTEMVENVFKTVPADAKPKTPAMQFVGKNGTEFNVYTTINGKAKGL